MCEPRQTLLTEGLDTVRIQECPVLGVFTSAPVMGTGLTWSLVLICSLLSHEYNKSLEAPPPSLTSSCVGTPEVLTLTSLPRLTVASTCLTPWPLPICQMSASAGWLLNGHSRACSSYHTVLQCQQHSQPLPAPDTENTSAGPAPAEPWEVPEAVQQTPATHGYWNR